MRSFGFACAGLATLLREQHNARLHALATLAVVILLHKHKGKLDTNVFSLLKG